MSRCAYLDDSGEQCQEKTRNFYPVFLTTTIYKQVQWISAPLCKLHRESAELREQRVIKGKVRDMIIGDDFDLEWLCEHKVGHSKYTHTCDYCCIEGVPKNESKTQ